MNMEKINYHELQDALEYIKKICESAQEEQGCAGCPLGNNDGECLLRRMPKNWRTRHPEMDVFRMLA